MGFGILLIGDELLTGKRQDSHLRHVIDTLRPRGLSLDWAHTLGDVPARITATLRETLAGDDVVFCFGGIGATPDDHTRAAAAAAAGRPLEPHAGALAEIEARFGHEGCAARRELARLPAGSTLIPNPVNRVPGFSLDQHHFLPGFPVMAWPMLDWLLDTHYADRCREPDIELRLIAPRASEGELLELMNRFVAAHPDVTFSSLPHIGSDERHIEFGVRGPAGRVHPAFAAWCEALAAQGQSFVCLDSSP